MSNQPNRETNKPENDADSTPSSKLRPKTAYQSESMSGIIESDSNDSDSLSSYPTHENVVQPYRATAKESRCSNQQPINSFTSPSRTSTFASTPESIDSEASNDYRRPRHPSIPRHSGTGAQNNPNSTLSSVPTTPSKRRSSAFSNRFQRSNSLDKGDSRVDGEPINLSTSRVITRQYSYARSNANAFALDGTLPSSLANHNEDIISLLLDEDSEDTENSDAYNDTRVDDFAPSISSINNYEKSSDINKMEGLHPTNTLTRIQTIKDQVTSEVKEKLEKIGFFDPRFDRVKLLLNFAKGYVFMIGILVCIFSLFWGSMYRRETRLVNMKVLVVLDNPNTYTDLDIEDYFSNTIRASIQDSAISLLAGWEPVYYPSITNDTSELRDKLIQEVHHQHKWGCVLVKPNSSIDYYNALNSGTAFNLSSAIEVIYETGRAYVGINSFLSNSFTHLESQFLKLQTAYITIPLVNKLTDPSVINGLSTLLAPIQFTVTDLTDSKLLVPIVAGPQQFGLIYLNLLSLMQFAFFQPFHMKMVKRLTDKSFIIYRLISSQITYLFMGLAYTLVQVSFGINIYEAYSGKTGFLIFWLVTYLMLSALGGVNENVVFIIQCRKPQLAPTWIFFWMVVNIAPTYYPMALSPHFYRYGYAFPIQNGFELFKILLFNTYKISNLARNILVLVAWVVITHTMLPFTMMYYSNQMSKKTLEKIAILKRIQNLGKDKKKSTPVEEEEVIK